MAKEMQSQEIIHMTDRQVFEELVNLYARAAGEALSSILKADIEITSLEVREMTVRNVEYGILEPAIFVRSCLTSNVAGNTVGILRQRDMQALLNELMGIDDLPEPDFEFDDVAMSAATELMNQMLHAAAAAMAKYLGDTMDAAPCQLLLSDGRQDLSSVIGEEPDASAVVVRYRVKIKDMLESEFLHCISAMAADSLYQEIRARRETEEKARAEKEAEEEKLLKSRPVMTAAPGSGRTVKAAKAENGPVRDFSGMTVNENLMLIMDVPLNVSVEIGKTRRRLKDVLNFSNGTVVELDKQADAPVDIIVNGQLIARGEVVVIDDNFGVRISEIVNTRSIIGNGE